jgi:hypothetical protein
VGTEGEVDGEEVGDVGVVPPPSSTAMSSKRPAAFSVSSPIRPAVMVLSLTEPTLVPLTEPLIVLPLNDSFSV